MKTAVTVLGPFIGLLLGALLQQSSAGRTWWREKRAEAYAGVLAAVEDLRHRFDLITEPHNYGGRPLESDDMIGLTKELRAAEAVAQLYAGPTVRRALSDYRDVLWRQGGASPEDVGYAEILQASEAVAFAMQAELRGSLRRLLR